jgi:hypothetical protein
MTGSSHWELSSRLELPAAYREKRGDESKSERDFTATHSSHTGVDGGEGTWQKLRARKNQAAELFCKF